MKTKIVVLFKVIVFMIAILTACEVDVNKIDTSTNSTNTEINKNNQKGNPSTITMKGNSNANLNNDGIAAISGEWIYYCNYSDNGKLYKLKNDGSNKVKLCDDKIFNINVLGDWIYYTNLNERKYNIYKIKKDGTKRTKINNEKSSYVNVIGNWIFYYNSNVLYRINTDGEDKKEICKVNKGSTYLNICDDVIYYINDGFLYKMSIDGTQQTKLCNDKVSYYSVDNEYIFYNDFNSCINRINKDGTKKTKLIESNTTLINSSSGWVYYFENGILCKISQDGKNKKELIYNDQIDKINVVGKWIFYSVNSGESEVPNATYRIDIDGSITNEPNDSGWSKVFPLKITASSYLKKGIIEYKPQFVADRKMETSWVEGKDDEGINEWIKLLNTRQNGDQMIETVKGIRIINGYAESKKLFYENNRVKKVKIEFSDGSSIIRDLDDGVLSEDGSLDYQELDFGREIETTFVKITILDIYKGSKHNDTCISEIHVF